MSRFIRRWAGGATILLSGVGLPSLASAQPTGSTPPAAPTATATAPGSPPAVAPTVAPGQFPVPPGAATSTLGTGAPVTGQFQPSGTSSAGSVGVPAPLPKTPPFGGVTVGGLAPPAPLTAEPSDEASLTEELAPRKEESGRGLSWFWLEVQGGYEHVGLQTFNVDEANFSAGLIETEADGGALSAGIGAKLVVLTLGLRGRLGFFDAWSIGRVGGELGFRIPIGVVEPRFDLGAGYAAAANLDDLLSDAVSLTGFYARAGAGIDFFPANFLAIGVHGSFDVLGLTRPGLSPADLAALQAKPDLANLTETQRSALLLEGSGYGSTFAIQGSLGLHF